MTIATGTRLGPYEILGSLGAGGMGEVYRARDTRLDRDVAIKVLSETFAEDPERLRRFEQEARTLAALSQPNIVQVFDTGEHDRRPYLVMELVEGETLRQQIEKGRLPWPKAAEILAAVADGLAAAHAKGIVHRDLKPENLVLTVDGQVKILDFGLARLRPTQLSDATTVDAASLVTVDGALVGTVGYMAPEQVQGRPADARSDLFALGCVLYEMLTGQRAFTRDSTAETLAAILRDPVPRVSLSQGGPFGPELEQVLSRCLEKAPAERFQNARDLAVALRTLAGAATGGAGPAGLMPETAGSKAIVVLPFENLSPDPDNAYFADGLTEEIIADLSKVRALRVISRTSAMHYKGAAKPLPVIAEELRVRYVLEGSVRKSGNSLRITANLIEANGELHLWGEKYSGTFDDVFAMQEQVSRAIVEALKVELTPQEARRLAEHPTQNPAAYECYLMARAEIWGLDGASLQRAMIILEQGLRRTPDDPLLLAGMAYTHWQRVNIGVAQEEELLIAEALATRALERSADLALGHLVLGLLMVWRPGRIKDAFRHFTRTLEINPNDLDAFAWLGLFSALLGRTESAAAYSARMIAINPLDWTSYLGLVWSQLMEGRFREVLATLGQLRRLAPDNEAVALFAIHPLLALGRDAEAGVLADAAERSDDPEVYHRLYPLLWYAHRGNREKVLSLLTPDLLETSRRDPEYSYRVATVYAVLGESDAALDWLGNAVHRGFLNHRYLSEVDPFLVSLRGDPRFRALMDEARELARAFGD